MEDVAQEVVLTIPILVVPVDVLVPREFSTRILQYPSQRKGTNYKIQASASERTANS